MRKPAVIAVVAAALAAVAVPVGMSLRGSGPTASASYFSCGGLEPTPQIAPTLPPDTRDSHQPAFDCFAWQEFIALNWKAAPTAGLPDLTAVPAQFGAPATPGSRPPTVWESYLSPSQVFKPAAATPDPWGSPERAPPDCRQTTLAAPPHLQHAFYAGYHVLPQTSKFSPHASSIVRDFIEAGTNGFWLTSQQGKLTRYEIRLNQDEYRYIVQNGFYNADNQLAAVKTPGAGVDLPDGTSQGGGPGPYGSTGAIELKAAWVEIDDPAQWPQYLMTTGLIIDQTRHGPVCHIRPMGLVGLHIIHKTGNAQQFVWATFEHVYNAPDRNAPAPVPTQTPAPYYRYYNPDCNPSTNHYGCVANATPRACPGRGTPTSCDPHDAAMQIVRLQPFPTPCGNAACEQMGNVTDINRAVHGIIRQANPQSVFQYYELVDVVWPTSSEAITPGESIPLPDGGPQPRQLANTTIETYFQGGELGGSNCLNCHQMAPIANPTPSVLPTYDADYSFLLSQAQSPHTHARPGGKP